MEKHYLAKQEIINFLGIHDDNAGVNAPSDKKLVHFNKIQSTLNQYSKLELLDYLDELSSSGYINCSMQFDNSTFFILGKGRSAYRQNQFLIDGKKEELEISQIESITKTNESVRKTNMIQIISAITTFLIISTALTIQFMSYNKEKTERLPIEDSLLKVKMRLDKLETKSVAPTQIKDSIYASPHR